MKKFLQNIFSIKNEKQHKVIRLCGFMLKVKNKKFNPIYSSVDRVNFLEQKIEGMIKRSTPQPFLRYFEVHLTEHCNLKCKSCTHFSCIAEEEYTDINIFENDIKRMSELSNGNVGIINLLGGEPLLHPKCSEFMGIARKYFPDSVIEITTNGILLKSQNDKFWDACKNNNIKICCTKYPINIDWDNLKDYVKSKGVAFEYYGGSGDNIIKTTYKFLFDLDGKQDPVESFLNCWPANKCVFLSNGKLFTCTEPANVRHFNKFFNKNLKLSQNDYIDIYKADNMAQILDFLSKPIPFCKYCNVKGRTFGHKWGISKKEIEEWI